MVFNRRALNIFLFDLINYYDRIEKFVGEGNVRPFKKWPNLAVENQNDCLWRVLKVRFSRIFTKKKKEKNCAICSFNLILTI